MITTTIYVDYENRETLSELAYVQRVIMKAKENEGNLDAFEDFLLDIGYDIVATFELSEEEKEIIWQHWKDHCLQWAQDDLSIQFEEIEIQL